ncbi:CLUMA_CG008805, isoform A [Clunio marinus]|uniref:CLUMA_CG008805, isoform A n=1 Tax=Clunio marinus TaxID=568069 RepID=A0A1J1I8H1_9DIPT|nr:CLUMA_CG008805, isoform A [Clunio marinus]
MFLFCDIFDGTKSDEPNESKDEQEHIKFAVFDGKLTLDIYYFRIIGHIIGNKNSCRKSHSQNSSKNIT